MRNEKTESVASFQFRDLHPDLFMGTASDRYAGWMGQIYTEERFGRNIARRSKKVGGKTFREEVLPVQSVEEYFRHFRILELDFTFYLPLLDREEKPTRVFHLLRSYRQHLKKGDRIILKAPQVIFARKIFRQGKYIDNEHYLNPGIFIKQFHEPAIELLAPWLEGIVFEQEYQRKGDRASPEEQAAELDTFFGAIPGDNRYHVELRTEALLTGAVFKILEGYDVGQVLSHWTWLPALSKQFALSGKRFLNRNSSIIRLMTPNGMRYEDAYARAHPFNALIKGMQSPGMVQDTIELIKRAIEEKVRINVIVNNRAGGNAPLIAQQIANGFLAVSEIAG
ncbi:MAG TPA: DUF72 domain-containing protein [Deltaproteobacteria bacterium]|nr:DUF72 domain-containing protein [Deltaproteobacteria bacterium]